MVRSKILRFDGRDYDELRPMKAEVGVVPNADGSAIFGFGNTIAIAAVYGPRSVPKFIAEHDRAVLRVRYNMFTFSVPDRKKPSPGRREIELSEIIKRALEPMLFLEEFPGTVIDVYVEIMQANAGTRTAGINAAAMALADAGIFMRDLPVAVAAGKIGSKIVIDLTKEEEDYNSEALRQDPEKAKYIDFYGEGSATDIPIVVAPRTKDILVIQMDGDITRAELEKAINLAISKAPDIRRVMEEAIIRKYKRDIF